MIINETMNVKIELSDVNKLTIQCDVEGATQYAFYVYRDEEIIARFPYTESNTLAYWVSESGTYYAKAFAKSSEEDKISKRTEKVHFEEEKVFGVEDKDNKKYFWNNIMDITKEIISNKQRIVRIAQFDYKLENKDTYLGILWSVLTPLIQIGTFWFVFGIGLRSGRDIDGYPYLVWMLAGIIPWFFISACLLKGANSIYSKVASVTKMRFPISTVPISRIVQQLYEFVVMLLIMVVVMFFNGIRPSWSWINLIYYFIYSFVFCASLSLVTSVLSMLVRDFYKLLNSIIRLLFYLTPILWVMDSMPEFYQEVMNYNPIYYVVQGFRDSILYQVPFYERGTQMLVLWILNILIYIWGCVLQAKFKNKFVDLV